MDTFFRERILCVRRIAYLALAASVLTPFSVSALYSPVPPEDIWFEATELREREVCEDIPDWGRECWDDYEEIPRAVIRDGGTYALDTSKLFRVQPDSIISEKYAPGENDGDSFNSYFVLLYYIDPDGTRRDVGGEDGWPLWPWVGSLPAGRYEADIYVFEDHHYYVTYLRRALTFLAGGASIAEAYDLSYLSEGAEIVGTMRFTIVDANAPSCCSSVVFLPGIKGSVLESEGDTLWPADAWNDDIPKLALRADGTSVHDVRVGDILDAYPVGPLNSPVYAPFSEFMNRLVSNGVIRAWLPLAYDWRYTPDQILERDITHVDGSTSDILDSIKQLATESPTGKVTIVAHSMGGLLGKAIIKKLEEEREDGIIDSFVMIGTPQLGTPQAIASLLHGDGEGIFDGFIVDARDVRAIAQDMPSAYTLLPSFRYFDTVLDPVITFDTGAAFTSEWRTRWGNEIRSFGMLAEFAMGQGVVRPAPAASELNIPEVLRSDLLAQAAHVHDEYDTYTFPDHIRVVQVAGWGIPTTKSVRYTSSHDLQLGLERREKQGYETTPTSEGDGTVVYPSAISTLADNTFYFNLAKYQKAARESLSHKDLLSGQPVQSLVQSVILKEGLFGNSYLSTAKPNVTELEDALIVSTHSPVILGVFDAEGRFTGIPRNQDLTAPVLAISEEIPGSTFSYTSDSQYIFLPKEGHYTFLYKGIGEGPTTVTVQSVSGDSATPVASFSDIPTTEQTNAIFSISGDNPGAIEIEVSDGDGQTKIFAPDSLAPSLSILIEQLRTTISSGSLKDKAKQNLLKRVSALEKRIEAKKQKNARTLAAFKQRIAALSAKGKLAATSATEISSLLDALESSAEEVVLNKDVLASLKESITSLNVKANIKNDLLKRVERLEEKRALTRTLASISTAITKKASSGKLSESDAQKLADIVSQIETII